MTDAAAAGTDAAWGYYDLHSTPTASPYLRHQRRSYSTSPHRHETKMTASSPLPTPLRTIRRVTCLHQLGGLALTHSSFSSTLTASTSSGGLANAMMVPPLPKHSPTIHKWVSLTPPPTVPSIPQVDRTSNALATHDRAAQPLMAKIGILRQNGRSVLVCLQDQHLTWQAVDAALEPVKGATKQILVVTSDRTTVHTSKKHWTITTDGRKTVFRFDCPSAGACSAWVRTLDRVRRGAIPPPSRSPPLAHQPPSTMEWTAPSHAASAASLAWATSTAPIRISGMHPHPPQRGPLYDQAALDDV